MDVEPLCQKSLQHDGKQCHNIAIALPSHCHVSAIVIPMAWQWPVGAYSHRILVGFLQGSAAVPAASAVSIVVVDADDDDVDYVDVSLAMMLLIVLMLMLTLVIIISFR